MRRSQRRKLLLIALLVTAIAGARFLPVESLLTAIVQFEERSPLLAIAGYVAGATLLIVILTPGWIIMMLAGLMFGFVQGFLFATLAVTLGASLAFALGRTIARDWVRRRIVGNPMLEALDEAVETQSFRIVFLTRVALVLPFNLLNYLYGATGTSTSSYMLATLLGMLPATAILVYLGSLSENLGALLSREQSLDATSWLVIAVAVVAIATVIRIIQQAARQALEKNLEREAKN